MFETKAFQHVLINVAKYERVRFVALAACTHESNAFRRVLITRANNERVQFGASNFHCGNQGVERVVVCAPWGACLAERVLRSVSGGAERVLGLGPWAVLWGAWGLARHLESMLLCRLTDVCSTPPVGTRIARLCTRDGCVGGVSGGGWSWR